MTADLDDLYQLMTDRLTLLRQERTELEEILAFYAKVLAAQQQTQQQTAIPEIDLPEERLRLKVEEGFPLKGAFSEDLSPFDGRESSSGSSWKNFTGSNGFR